MAKRSKREKDALDNIIDQLDLDGVTQDELFGEGGLVKALTSRILNKALEAEMDNHLGYQKNSSSGNNSGNNRNGYSNKKVLTRDQEVDLSIPRDRNGEFAPVIVPKHEKRLPIFNEQIIALYSSGMTVRDIQAHLQDIYGVEVSPELVSRVTDGILTEVREWRNRPLNPVYPIVYLDALRVNSRESGKNQNKALYIALGINRSRILKLSSRHL